MAAVAQMYGQNATDVNALFNLVVMDIVYGGALEGEDISLTNDEREYIYYAAHPRRFIKCKSSDADRKKNYLNGWIPRVRESGKSYKNGRVSRLMKMMGISEEQSKELLSMYWDAVLVGGQQALTPEGNGEYYFSTDKFVVVVGNENSPIYVCDTCGKTTMTNCKNSCTSLKCDGHISSISRKALMEGNHYARLYSEKMMSPLHNQTIHDKLNRMEAYSFLEHYCGPTVSIPDDQFEETYKTVEEEFTEEKIQFGIGYNCTSYQNWNEFAPMVPEEYLQAFSDMDMAKVPIPSESYCKLSVIGTDLSTEALFIWKNQKVLVFDNDNEKIKIQGWKSYSVSEIVPSKFAAHFR